MEHKRMSEILNDWTDIQTLWDDAFVESSKRARAAQNENVAAEGVNADDNVYSLRNSEYSKYLDEDLINFAEDVEKGNIKGSTEYVISNSISEKLANEIERVTGIKINAKNCSNTINTNAIEHIINDHGKNGAADKTMKDISNVGLIEYALNNFTNIMPGKKSNEFRNSNNIKSDNVEIETDIGNSKYYTTIEAVQQLKGGNRLRVVSVYIKNKASQEGNVKSLPVTSETKLVIASDSNIAQQENEVNNNDTARRCKLIVSCERIE